MLIIFLAALLTPELISAQARVNNATRSPAQRANPPAQRANPQSQNPSATQAKKSETPIYTLAQDNNFAHWSIGGGIGISMFDGDINESAKRVFPAAAVDYVITGNIERTFNPVWGLGIGYSYIPYAADPDKSTHQLRGRAQEADIYLSLNMLNLFYRYRPQKWGIFFNVGMGMSLYSAKMTDSNTGFVVKDHLNNPMDLTDGVAIVWPMAALVEFNMSRYWAVGFKAEYRLHDKDNYEGYTENVRQGNWNDAFELFSLTLRYKPHFGKEHHVRNMSYGEVNMREINRRLAEMENMIKNMNKVDTCCANNTGRIAIIEKRLEQKPDTVVIIREVQSAPSVVPAAPSVAPAPQDDGFVDDRTKKIFNEALRGVQFETARADIRPVSQPILEKVVNVMKENPKFDLDIIGHTDNVGDAKSNLDLSDRRAHAVRMYLMNKGVDGTRLTSSGKGLTEPVATNNTAEGRALNRRVEFIVKQNGNVLFKSVSE